MKKPKRSGARAKPAHLLDTSTIAQAVADGLDFVTNDEPIRKYAVQTIW